MKIQSKFNRVHVRHENFEDQEASVLLPNRVPTLAKIAEMFISGRPIDASLNRNLGYNEIEGNPMLAKGLDLADIPKIAKGVGVTLQEVADAIEQAKIAKGTASQVENPATEEPTSIPTE